ncbi:MAG: class I SAM-dependent methyltransferase [Candidatus Hydrogenedentes bacterium]|nr:class I SAM-dependent methyltransferase [Candidatus Hydrogenedentota bacterium]
MERTPEPEMMDLPEEAAAYAAADFSRVNTAFVARILDLAPGESAVLADLGCGPGDICCRIRAARPGWRVVGVDAAHAMLAIASENAKARAAGVVYVESDAKALPLRAGAFTIICSNSILHHLSAPLDFWREVRRIAAPGAVVLMRDLFRPPTATAARAIVEEHARDESALLQEEYYRSLLAAFTPDEVRGQLEAAGLGSLAVEVVTDRHMDIHGRVG